ncbi:MAG TPA: helix-turn-helix domain-containing protein [Kofleriaceae bacterium]|nr:helix-turn-helix domain-containing protein [Kofleriaceae bacterium]
MPPAAQRTLVSASPARGVLASDGRSHQRILPCPELAPYVAHFWWVTWDLTQPFRAETLPHPTAHLIFESHSTSTTRTRNRASVHGVPTRRFTRTLRDRGRVFGIKLRPAALRAFTRAPASRFTDHRAPISNLLGPDGAILARSLRDTTTATTTTTVITTLTLAQCIAIAEPFLLSRATPLAPDVAAIRDLVDRIEHDRTIRRAEDAARILGCDERTLQRRFNTHVGVGAKSVIQRYRLMEAVEQLKHPNPQSLAALAADLGYADQAHFSRDFAAVVGQTPRAYAAKAAPTARRR